MTNWGIYKLERVKELMTIDSEISGQIYVVDEERKSVVVGLGSLPVSGRKEGILIGLTRAQAVSMANELLEIAEMFLEDGDSR